MSEDYPRYSHLRFTASGSEYFRIWAVNLLLSIVTLGLYLPFAKARRLRYFYANTLVDGHALAFHGNPWAMFRGHMVVWITGVAYALTLNLAPALSPLLLLLGMAAWPALWRASLRFRLSNTSWRGLRFGFEGTVGGAYRALLPFIGMGVLFGVTTAALGALLPNTQPASRSLAANLLMLGLVLLVLGGITVAMMGWGLYGLKRYQHAGYRVGQRAARMDARPREFMVVALKLALVGLAFMLAVGFCIGFLMPRIQATDARGQSALSFSGLILLAVIYGGFLVTSSAAWRAWLQNLAWSRTSLAPMPIRSNLSAMDLTLLNLRNNLLLILTLGLYRPFAVVATTALCLSAVRLEFLESPDGWLAGAPQAKAGAIGEMSGDYLGIDVGL